MSKGGKVLDKRRRIKRMALVLVLLMAVLLPTAVYFWRTPEPAPTQTHPLAGAEISVISAMNEDVASYLCDTFTKATGCKVNLVCLPVQQAMELIQRNDAQADVFLGGTAQAHRKLRDEDKLQRAGADPSLFARFYVDLDQGWTPILVDLFAIGVNGDLMGMQKLPSTLEELAQPEYRGMITMADPATSYTGFTLAYSILRVYGEQRGSQLLNAIWGNVAEFTQTDLVAAQKTAQGIYPLTIGLYADHLRMVQAGYPLSTVVYPGAGWTIAPLSILANTSQPQLARAFRDFCISQDVLSTAIMLNHSLSPLRDAVVTIQDFPISGAARVYTDYAKLDTVSQLFQSVVQRNPQIVFPVSRAPKQ